MADTRGIFHVELSKGTAGSVKALPPWTNKYPAVIERANAEHGFRLRVLNAISKESRAQVALLALRWAEKGGKLPPNPEADALRERVARLEETLRETLGILDDVVLGKWVHGAPLTMINKIELVLGGAAEGK